MRIADGVFRSSVGTVSTCKTQSAGSGQGDFGVGTELEESRTRTEPGALRRDDGVSRVTPLEPRSEAP